VQNSSSLDKKDSSFGFLAGYRFTPYLAAEGAYLDLGALAYRARTQGSFPDDPTTLTTNFDSETSGIALSGLAILPVSYRLEVYARAGVLLATNNFKLFLEDRGDTFHDEFSESSTDLLAGAGVSWSFFEIYDARLEFQRVFDAGDEATGEGDVDVVSLGIKVAF
jgi:hypothetical protein